MMRFLTVVYYCEGSVECDPEVRGFVNELQSGAVLDNIKSPIRLTYVKVV